MASPTGWCDEGANIGCADCAIPVAALSGQDAQRSTIGWRNPWHCDALGGDGVPLTNARVGLITPTLPAVAAVDSVFCAGFMTQEVFVQ